MARVEVTQYYDDLDKTPLDRDNLEVVEFSYRGINYTMDLSKANAEKFTEVLKPYMQVATRVQRGQRGPGRRTTQGRRNPERNRKIRAWAQDQGLSTSKRGQISQEIIDAYEAQFGA